MAVVLTASACGDSPAGTPEPGAYDYVASHPLVGAGGDSMRHEGRLILEDASPDEISGRWEVSLYGDELQGGERVGDAYEVYAFPTYGGTVVHRLRPTATPGELACEGYYSIVLEDLGETQVPLVCAIGPSSPTGIGADTLVDSPTRPGG